MARRGRDYLSRYREIGSVIAKYGFSDVIAEAGLGRFFPRLPRGPVTPTERVELRARNLRLALQELGPTFIKAGQVLSSRPDLLPPEFIEELEKLQDKVAPFGFDQVKMTVEEELGKNLDEVFATFAETPVASASLSQVHEAVLTSGERVAVKVRRPGIRKVIDRDIRIFYDLASVLQRSHTLASHYDFVGIVEEFDRAIHEELEFRLEASNIERVRKSVRGFEHIDLPIVYFEHSSQAVLALEFIDGFSITDVDRMEQEGIDGKAIATDLFRAYIKQIIEDGFFHADPHPGNLLVTPDGIVYMIDLGMVGRLDGNLRSQIARLLINLVDQDSDALTETIMYMGIRSEETNFEQLSRDIGNLITTYYGRAVEAIGLSNVLNGLIAIISRNKIRVPSNFALLAKTVVLVDGIVRRLDPEFNYSESLRASVRRVVTARLRAQYSVPRLVGAVLEGSDLVGGLPRHANLLIEKAVKDDIGIKIELHRLEGIERTINQATSLLSIAVIISAIVIGSALVVLAGISPKFLGIPVFGMLGFLIASIFGFYLIYRILRSR